MIARNVFHQVTTLRQMTTLNFKVNQPVEIIPEYWQESWFNRIIEILSQHHMYVDTSDAGAGKTFAALHTAKKFNSSIFVVCPTTLVEQWRLLAEMYEVPVIDVLSYETLRGTNKGVKHNWLKKSYTSIVTDSGTTKEIEYYETTDSFNKACDIGVLLLLDEPQKVKNVNSLSFATQTLVSQIINSGRSRVGLLSRTPNDREDQILNFFRTCGIMSTREPGKKINKASVIQESVDMCFMINRPKTYKAIESSLQLTNDTASMYSDNDLILSLINAYAKKSTQLLTVLYHTVIKPCVAGCMVPPPIEHKC
jgi:hypothetical protein